MLLLLQELLLANIEKLPDLPEQNQSIEATCDIPDTDAVEPDSAAASVPQAGSIVNEETAAAASQNDRTPTPSESAP